jgi:hypothetical protein
MKKSFLLVFLLVSALGFSQDEPVEVPMIVTKVPLGEMVQFENATVKFIKVIEDSRCPKDVTCIWAGQAKVLVEVIENGKASKEVELLFDGKKINMLSTSEGYALRGMSLSPYPVSETVGKMDYVLLISEGEK